MIKWEGLGYDEATWEILEDLKGPEVEAAMVRFKGLKSISRAADGHRRSYQGGPAALNPFSLSCALPTLLVCCLVSPLFPPISGPYSPLSFRQEALIDVTKLMRPEEIMPHELVRRWRRGKADRVCMGGFGSRLSKNEASARPLKLLSSFSSYAARFLRHSPSSRQGHKAQTIQSPNGLWLPCDPFCLPPFPPSAAEAPPRKRVMMEVGDPSLFH